MKPYNIMCDENYSSSYDRVDVDNFTVYVELHNCKVRYMENIGDNADHIDPNLWNVETYVECNNCLEVFDEWTAQDGCQPFQLADYTKDHCQAIFDDVKANPRNYIHSALHHVCDEICQPWDINPEDNK